MGRRLIHLRLPCRLSVHEKRPQALIPSDVGTGLERRSSSILGDERGCHLMVMSPSQLPVSRSLAQEPHRQQARPHIPPPRTKQLRSKFLTRDPRLRQVAHSSDVAPWSYVCGKLNEKKKNKMKFTLYLFSIDDAHDKGSRHSHVDLSRPFTACLLHHSHCHLLQNLTHVNASLIEGKRLISQTWALGILIGADAVAGTMRGK